METIAAVSTPLGNGAIGIVRLSGPEALNIARQLFQPAGGSACQWASHRAYYGMLHDPEGKLLDHCLLLYMQQPRSFTGEDMVELQCHGGHYLLQTVLEACLQLGARLATPGEFSQRAFLNGKIDLTQSEAIMDLIHSPSRQGLHMAAYQLKGNLSEAIQGLRQQLLELLATLEANIDFPDEVDPPDPDWLAQSLQANLAQVEALLATSRAGRIWKQGLKLAIIGEPNVGKSTLLNALLRYERAIVSEIAGTTRDTVEDDYNLKGIPIRVIDTAGLRETEDTIEAIGIARSRQALAEADLVLLIADARKPIPEELRNLYQQCHRPPEQLCVVVYNKSDLAAEAPAQAFEFQMVISALHQQGLVELEDQLFQLLTQVHHLEHEVSINERHRLCLLNAAEALEKTLQTLQADLPADFMAIDLKTAIQAFGEVIGQSISEQVIHEIFHRFCVGK